jgi:DNA-binding PadR family transcriptional regulator
MPTMPKQPGEFEQAVLLAVARLGDEAYGVTIREDIARYGRPGVSIGALYVTLERLEGKGYLRSQMGEATAIRGGRAKRYYTITAAGMAALRAARKRQERMWSGVDLGPVK